MWLAASHDLPRHRPHPLPGDVSRAAWRQPGWAGAGGGQWSLDTVQIRDFAADKHRTVDDTPAGGGAGMVLRADVLARGGFCGREFSPTGEGPRSWRRGSRSVDSGPLPPSCGGPPPRPGRIVPILAMTPRGKPLTQARVRELAAAPASSSCAAGSRGFDERIFAARAIEEVSVGDIVLSGGEPAALMLLDACIRLLPGVMGAAFQWGRGVVRERSCSNIRTIPGPLNGKGARSPKCCDRGIMRRSRRGAKRRPR